MLIIKQHDTYPAIKAALKQLNETTGAEEAINLTGAKEVTIVIKSSGGSVKEYKATVSSATKGEVEWTPVEAFTETVGVYKIEFKIEWSTGQYQTVPNEGYGSVEIVAFLGEAH